jgi:hypothetical protein
MSSHGLGAFCLEPSYIEAFDILNLPSFAAPASIQLSSNLSWLAVSSITTYIDSPASILPQNFSYESITSLPLSKPLAIQCPVAACIFPISGYFTFLQRILLYINICVATFALHVPLLRGVSQIWLTTFWFSVLAMFVATMITTKVPMIYNLDLQPALLVVHIGILPTLLWFSFRAEPGDSRDLAARAGDSEERENTEVSEHSDYEDLRDDAAEGREANFGHDAEQREDAEHPEGLEDPPVPAGAGFNASEVSWWRKHVLNFPVTRILVPAYGLFDLANAIMANVVLNSAGFWPTATAVIVSNGTNYLLTSPCFQDSTGYVGLWPPYPSSYNGIRNINYSLSIFYPPPGTKATDAMQAIPRTDITILHVGSVFICFMICILSLTSLNWLEESLDIMYVLSRHASFI